METGSVSLLDALGFKGIWRRVEPEALLTKLQALYEEMLDVQRHALATDLTIAFRPSIKVRFLSDTIVIAVAYHPWREPRDSSIDLEAHCNFTSLWTVCNCTSIALGLGGALVPRLAYRGAIAFGQFEIRDQFLIGPAIDEAAASESLAEGAFVWFCPSALERFNTWITTLGSNPWAQSPWVFPILRDFHVPLKDGRSYRTHVVNPLARIPDVDQVAEGILSTFSSESTEIQVKKRNTAMLLAQARPAALNDPWRAMMNVAALRDAMDKICLAAESCTTPVLLPWREWFRSGDWSPESAEKAAAIADSEARQYDPDNDTRYLLCMAAAECVHSFCAEAAGDHASAATLLLRARGRIATVSLHQQNC